MPYKCELIGSRWKLTKKSGGDPLGSHETKKECQRQMRAVYSTESQNPKNIIYNGYIYDSGMLDDQIKDSGDETNVWINSKGGDFIEAISIHNKLRNSGKKIITHIDPFAISAGAVVALAGDEIYIVENGAMMFHAPKMISSEAKTAEQLAEDSKTLEVMKNVFVNTITSRTKMSEVQARELISKDTWFTAEEALKIGLVDEIIPIYRDVKLENSFPDRIVNYLKEKEQMPLKEICAKFGVDESEDKLIAFIESLMGNQQKKPPVTSPEFVNMVRDARIVQIDSLFAAGKATPVVIAELKTKFGTEAAVISDAASGSKEFENIIALWNKNEKIINFGGSTGGQGSGDTSKLGDENKDKSKKSPTLSNAERRAAKARERVGGV